MIYAKNTTPQIAIIINIIMPKANSINFATDLPLKTFAIILKTKKIATITNIAIQNIFKIATP